MFSIMAKLIRIIQSTTYNRRTFRPKKADIVNPFEGKAARDGRAAAIEPRAMRDNTKVANVSVLFRGATQVSLIVRHGAASRMRVRIPLSAVAHNRDGSAKNGGLLSSPNWRAQSTTIPQLSRRPSFLLSSLRLSIDREIDKRPRSFVLSRTCV